MIDDPAGGGPVRGPDRQRLDLQLRARLPELGPFSMTLFADLFNVLTSGTETYATDDGPTFGQVTSRAEKLGLRLGAEVGY